MKDYIKDVFLWGMLIGLGSMVSCQDDMLVNRQQSGNAIVFTTDADSLVSSRASSVASSVSERHFLGLVGKDSLYITLTEEENMTPVFPVSGSDVHSRAMYGDFTNFYLNAYLDDDSEFMINQEVSKSGNNWNYTPVKYWPQNQSVNFFGYASSVADIKVVPEIDKDTYTCTFDYTLPQAADDKKDAEGQPDLVFSILTDQSKQSVNGKVHLPFYHALSAIQFSVGTLPEDITFEDDTAWDISLASVSTSGDCTYTKGTPLNYQWKNTNTSGTYTQRYSFKSLKEGISASQTFMMIPQTLEKATLKIAFTYAGNNYAFEKALDSFNSGQWDANKKYIYKISISEAVEVDITDKVNGNVKSDVVIRNTGLSDAYIRATIVGYWENAEGNVVDWWDSTQETDGKFEKDADWDDYWIQNQKDGFYYYKYPIKVGDTPGKPLFKTYTLERKDAPAGATLKLNIVVQAVKYESDQESLKEAWPDAPSSGINTDLKKE